MMAIRRIPSGLKTGKPRIEVDHSRSITKSAERLDGKVREGESVADYQRRVLGQIEGLDWGSKGDDEPEI